MSRVELDLFVPRLGRGLRAMLRLRQELVGDNGANPIRDHLERISADQHPRQHLGQPAQG